MAEHRKSTRDGFLPRVINCPDLPGTGGFPGTQDLSTNTQDSPRQARMAGCFIPTPCAPALGPEGTGKRGNYRSLDWGVTGWRGDRGTLPAHGNSDGRSPGPPSPSRGPTDGPHPPGGQRAQKPVDEGHTARSWAQRGRQEWSVNPGMARGPAPSA